MPTGGVADEGCGCLSSGVQGVSGGSGGREGEMGDGDVRGEGVIAGTLPVDPALIPTRWVEQAGVPSDCLACGVHGVNGASGGREGDVGEEAAAAAWRSAMALAAAGVTVTGGSWAASAKAGVAGGSAVCARGRGRQRRGG